MRKPQWLLALPLILAATIGSASAATIRDDAGIFDADTIRQVKPILDRIERNSQLPITIETIESLRGDDIETASRERVEQSGLHGIFVLIAKDEHKIEVGRTRAFVHAFPNSRLKTIRAAFIEGFKKNDFNAGLTNGVRTLDEEVSAAKAENGGVLRSGAPVPARGAPPFGRRAVPAPRQTFGVGSLLTIGIGIIAILFVLRLIGGMFGAGNRGYPGPGRMGGPGYGAPGYGGGGGGGFMSSMFGGIGGALAGNWLYDQFSGRNHHGGGYTDNASSADPGQGADAGGDNWGGGVSGDWGGGDGGGAGGDWGGGGGDGGGGGGDW